MMHSTKQIILSLSTITGRMILTGLALASLTVMLLIVGSVVAVSAAGQGQPVRIRQIAPLMTPTPLTATATAAPPVEYILAGGWEVTELLLPTFTPTPLPSPTPLPAATAPFNPTPIRPMPVFVGWPAGGKVTQGFGCSPYYSGIPGAECDEAAPWFHDGLDIANLEGAPVRAALAGTVIFVGPDTEGPVCGQYQGYGLSVIIDDGRGNRALYAHLSKIEAVVGQGVTPDTLIGAVGATGCTSGPHLHLGLQVQGQVVDPALFVKDEG